MTDEQDIVEEFKQWWISVRTLYHTEEQKKIEELIAEVERVQEREEKLKKKVEELEKLDPEDFL